MASSIKVYHISTTSPHTFFISEQQLLTHNFFPITLGLSLLFGGGIEFAGLTIGTSILGTIFGIKLLKERGASDNKTPIITAEWLNSYSGHSSPDPDDDDDNDKSRKHNTISKSEFFKKKAETININRMEYIKEKKALKGWIKRLSILNATTYMVILRLMIKQEYI